MSLTMPLSIRLFFFLQTMRCPNCSVFIESGLRYGMSVVKNLNCQVPIFRGLRCHIQNCKKQNKNLEKDLKEKMMAEPGNSVVMIKLLALIQSDGPPKERMSEAFNLCVRRGRDWRGSAEWQTAVLELCSNYKVKHYSLLFG